MTGVQTCALPIFMKDVDEKIKNKFPMCDEFLNVSWIVEEKVTGLLKYDILTIIVKKLPAIYSQ